MKKKELLEKYYDMEMQNIFCNSETWMMNKARKGCEQAFEEATIRAEMLKEMIDALGEE